MYDYNTKNSSVISLAIELQMGVHSFQIPSTLLDENGLLGIGFSYKRLGKADEWYDFMKKNLSGNMEVIDNKLNVIWE